MLLLIVSFTTDAAWVTLAQGVGKLGCQSYKAGISHLGALSMTALPAF